jgi:hypothetical protein
VTANQDTGSGPRRGRPRSQRGRHQLLVGDAFPVPALKSLETLSGTAATMPDPDHFVHVQMRRFSGCPICNLHLRSITSRLDEVTAAGVSEVVVFHSTTDELRRYESELPFTVAADPRKGLYRTLNAGVLSASRIQPTLLAAGPRGSGPGGTHAPRLPSLRPADAHGWSVRLARRLSPRFRWPGHCREVRPTSKRPVDGRRPA